MTKAERAISGILYAIEDGRRTPALMARCTNWRTVFPASAFALRITPMAACASALRATSVVRTPWVASVSTRFAPPIVRYLTI